MHVAMVKQFELEQVLRYRLDVERLRKQEFATAKQGFENAYERLVREEQQASTVSNEFSERQCELDSIEEIRRYADYFARKRSEIKTQKKRVAQLGHVLNERREVLLDATKDKKVLESLKERKEFEFRQEMDKKEQAFMDEIAIQKKEEQ